MKSIVLFLLLVVLSVPMTFGQIKIGDNPQNIDAASVLELESRDRVLVITRVNTAEMEAIVPQRGGLVFNTDTNCISYYDGTEWINLCDAAGITFTNEHLANTSLGPSIVITQNGSNYNFEVAPNSIRSEQIVDGGINGVDIQDNSIGESKLGTDSVSSNELRDNSVGSSEVVDGSIRPEDLANTIPEQVLTTDENGIPRWENAANLTNEVALDIAENAMDIADHIINDNDTDDRNELTDISFDKITNVLSLTRSETAVGQTTDLSSLIGSDDQTLTLTADNRLQIEDGNEIDLNIFNNSGSDNQTLSLNGNTLAITGGNDVSLAGFVNTDNQTLSIAGNTISLTNGGSIDLPPGTVDTDQQNLSLAGNTLNITSGTGVDLTPILASGADGVISQVALAGTDLNFTGAGGGFNGTVSLAGLGGGTGADGVITNMELTGTDLVVTGTAPGFSGTIPLGSLGGGTDNQQLTLEQPGNLLTLVNGGTPIDLTPFLDNQTVTDFSFDNTANILSITLEDGNTETVDLTDLAAGGTDNQQLTLEQPGNLLTLVDGGTPIDLTPFLDNQTVTDFSFDDLTNILTITLEDGNTETVDLSALATAAADNQTAAEVPFATYLTLNSPNTQGAIQQLKDELTAAIFLAGASDPSDELITNFTLTGTELNIAEGGNIPAPIDLDPTFVTEAELTTAITNYVPDWTNLSGIPADFADDIDNDTQYSAGAGLTLTGGEFSVDATTVAADWNNLTNIPANLDLDVTNDFDGEWLSLSNVPADLLDGDADTQYTAGAGLTLAAGEFSVDATTVAADWNNLTNIPANLDLDATDDFDGEWLNLINVPADLLDGDADTQYTAGAGLTLAAGEFSVDATTVAADWTNLTGIPADFADNVDNDTQYTAGAGLTLTGTTFAFDNSSITPDWTTFINVPAGFADDVDNDTQYTAGAGLTLTGTEFALNAGTIVADWGNLTGIPADFADNVDNDTQYTASGGLILTGTTFSLDAANVVANWSNLTGIPADIDDGDDDTTYTAGTGLTLTGTEFALNAGTIVADWSNLTSIPADIADGDDNTDAQTASLVPVAATPANYTAGTPDVEAHLVGIDAALAIGGQNLFNTNGILLSADRTHNLNGNDFVLGGSGNVAIGTLPGAPQSKLDVNGQIQARNGFASTEGDASNPGYGFYTNGDTNMGMYRIAADQLGFSTNGTEAMRIDAGQDVGIGVTNPQENLHVAGNIRANGSFISATTTYPDYVFQKYFTGKSVLNNKYQFENLEKIENFIKSNHHLPGIKSAKEVEKDGSWNLTEGAINNLEKIEELFLHTIEQEKKIKDLTLENKELSKKLETLQNDVTVIKQLLETKSKNE
jgi:hypothetical protein